MNDDQRNLPEPVEQVALTDLHQPLPEHIADTDTPSTSKPASPA